MTFRRNNNDDDEYEYEDVDDDPYYEEDEEDEDDEELGSRARPSVRPFAGYNSPTSTSRPGASSRQSPAARGTGNLPGNRPGNLSSSGRPPTGPLSNRTSTTSSSNRPGAQPFGSDRSSPSTGSNRPATKPFGSDRPATTSRPGTGPLAGSSGSNRPSSGGLASSSANRPGTQSPTSPGNRGASTGNRSFASSRPGDSQGRGQSGDEGKSSSGGLGKQLGNFRAKLPGAKPDNKPGGQQGNRSGGGNAVSQRLGNFRAKLPGAKPDNKPGGQQGNRSGGGNAVSQRLGNFRAKLPGAKPDNNPATPRGSTSTRSTAAGGPRLGARGAAGGAMQSRTNASAAPANPVAGLVSRLPFGNRQQTKSRTTTREKLERASKAPKIDERGLTLDNKLDILGVALLLGSLALFFSSMSSTKGQITEAFNTFFSNLLGTGAIAVPIVMFVVGVWLIVRHFGDEAPVVDPVRVSGIALLYLGILLLLQFLQTFKVGFSGIDLTTPDGMALAQQLSETYGGDGGYIGRQMYFFLVTNVTEAGMFVTMVGLIMIGVMLVLRITAAELAIFFISLWRSFIDAQRRRAQTREARARMAAQQLAAAAEAQVTVSKPPAPELTGGQAPALPAASPVESAEEPRPIPITMGGKTVTAFFDGSEAVPMEQAALPVGETNQPSIAARLFGGIGGRGNKTSAAAPVADKVAEPRARPAGLGGLFNRGSNEAAAESAQPLVPQQPAASVALPIAPSSPTPGQPTPPAPAQPASSSPNQPATASATLGDLLKPASPPAERAPQPAITEPDVEAVQDEEDESLRQLPPARPKGTGPATRETGKNVWARPVARSNESDQSSLAERRDRLNAIRSGQTAPPARADKPDDAESSAATTPPAATTSRPTPPLQTPERPQRQTLSGIPTSNGGTAQSKLEQPTPPSAARPISTPSPAFGRPETPPAPAAPGTNKRRNWQLPDYTSLLNTGSESDFDREMLLRRARIIEETLQSFGAPGRVVEVNTGPVITQFGVEPDYLTTRSGKKNRVKVGAIAQLDKDLQLALGAKSIRIEAPVPGKGFVGIEVPNAEASLVSLRDVMESDDFQKLTGNSPLVLGLGQSVDGTPISADLASMPHLLVAGTTGSGKSVLVNAIICSILVNNKPDKVKFIMVDPKRVELTGYNGIPHLVAPVVVDLERTVGVLKWVTREMDERYKQFSNASARNIEDFNKHLPDDREPMPYIVVVIDELADLMMLAPDETERVITRIAALARATGIHLVIATQRPSVDVVTGLIKANFPARIAFAVAGGVDSRVILDQPGAERLLGKGDMLYLSGNSPAPLRLQGVFVSPEEINNVTRYWKQQNAQQREPFIIKTLAVDDDDEVPTVAARAVPAESTTAPFESSSGSSSDAQQIAFWDDGADEGMELNQRVKDERDELYDQAVEMVQRLNKASVSLLQRRLRIGYTRAARLIDMMESEGIVGPQQEGSKPREVLKPHNSP